MRKHLNRIKRIEKQIEPNKQEISDEELQEKSKHYAKEIRSYLHDDVPLEEIDLVHFEDNTKIIDETMKQLTTKELRRIAGVEYKNKGE